MNGYFQIVLKDDGAYLRCFPQTEDGRPIIIKDVMDYLGQEKLPFDIMALNETLNGLTEEKDLFLCEDKPLPIKEHCVVNVSFDRMKAVMTMYPPSTDGSLCTKEDIASALRLQKIVFGVDDAVIDEFFASRQYGTPYTVAVGKPPREGKDAVINYYFQTDRKIRPQLREDGTVNYFDLDLVSHCRAGDLLAVLTPAEPGEPGTDVFGNPVRQREVKRLVLKFGKNIEANEEKTEIHSLVDGHVTLVDNTVFVSNVFEVENIDNSTGNIAYDGSVKINGNVCTNFAVKAKGNIEVKGTVEGAYLEAGGNIILARGINGMNRGKLVAGGNIISKFLENCTVTADGYIETETIMHSRVQSKTEIHVSGKKGNITGGYVSATNQISAKRLGTEMGIATNIMVGVDPEVIDKSVRLKKELDEAQKNLSKILPVIESTQKKALAGIAQQKIEQKKYLSQLLETAEQLKQTINTHTKELEECRKLISEATTSKVEVSGELCPGVTVTISDVSLTIREPLKFCRLRKRDGAVKVESL